MIHLAPLIHDLAVILAVAGLVTLLFQRIRQPVVLGYIVAGIIVGPHVTPRGFVSDIPNIKVWAELGVVFLMFSLGLEFSFRKLARVGISASITAVFEVMLMMVCGFATGRLLKWSVTDSLFLAAMVSISSTTIIVRSLDELKLKTRRFAEMIFGVLIVEDLIAILVLVALSTLATTRNISSLGLMMSAGKLFLVVGSWFLTGYFVLPRFMRYVGKVGSNEMLTILSIGLCLSLVVVAASQNYSVALGAFIMGSILAESTESHRIEDLIAPLRDLFAAIFFVSVGMLIDPRVLLTHSGSIFLITGVLVVGKIVNITLGAFLTGQTLRTSVQVGFGMAQIGEFSFILATLGQTLNLTSGFLYPVAVAVSVITTFTTPYLIRISHKLAVRIETLLPVRVRDALNKYVVWTQERKADSAKKTEFYQRAFRWVLNGLATVIAFTLISNLVSPFMITLVARRPIAQLISWLCAVAASAPFVWAMFSTFRKFSFGKEQNTHGAQRSGGTLLLSRLLTLLLIGLLSLEFFPVGPTLVVTAALASVWFFVFRKQLANSYQWFETTFLSTFENAPKSKKPTDVLRHLAPWDAYLMRFKVHPNSEISGKRLSDLDLRGRYGINIVVIQRGLKTIVAPHPNEQIFPKDELLVLGTDEQVESARQDIEKPPGLAERFNSLSGFELRQLLVSDQSQLNGRAIRESGIRESYGAMVVGLERGDQRMMNPNSNVVLRAGDILWIVGETDKINSLES